MGCMPRKRKEGRTNQWMGCFNMVHRYLFLFCYSDAFCFSSFFPQEVINKLIEFDDKNLQSK